MCEYTSVHDRSSGKSFPFAELSCTKQFMMSPLENLSGQIKRSYKRENGRISGRPDSQEEAGTQAKVIEKRRGQSSILQSEMQRQILKAASMISLVSYYYYI